MTYLIAGASSDIGRELIKLINEKEEGAVIFAHYNNGINKLLELSANSGIEIAGTVSTGNARTRVIPVKADLSDSEGAAAILDSIKENADKLGLAGVEGIGKFVFLPANKFNYMRLKDLDIDLIRKEMEISVYSFLGIAKELIPYMKKNADNPSIMAMLTKYVTDELPPKFMTDYIVSKYALMGAVKALKSECGSKINIGYLAPDMIETAFLSNIDPKIIEMNRLNGGGLLKPESVAKDIYERLYE